MHGDAGLRERKKDATRRALSAAAMALALERGYHGFTIADVADAAGVSRRTFSNYFPGKAECVVAACSDWMLDVLAEVRSTAPGRSLHELMVEIVAGIDEAVLDGFARFVPLLEAEPDLQARTYAADRDIAAAVTVELARLTGREQQDLQVVLLAAYGLHASRICLYRWLRDGRPDGRDGLRALMTTAMAVLDPEVIAGLIVDGSSQAVE